MSIDARTNRVGISKTFRNIRDMYSLSTKPVLDLGCGYGEYLRLFGTGSVGVTTTEDEVAYGKNNNLAIVFANAEKLENLKLDKKFSAIWANNLFEHLLSPHAFLMKLKKMSDAETRIILGVPVVPKIVSLMFLGMFRGALASNHISFFTHKTLALTVERAGWKVEEVRPFLFKNKILDILCRALAPHMYIVARNDTGFTYPPKKLKEWVADDHYNDLLSITRQK